MDGFGGGDAGVEQGGGLRGFQVLEGGCFGDEGERGLVGLGGLVAAGGGGRGGVVFGGGLLLILLAGVGLM